MFFAIHLGLLRFGKNEFRATIAAILFVPGVLRGVGYVAVGAFDRDALYHCFASFVVPLRPLRCCFVGDHCT